MKIKFALLALFTLGACAATDTEGLSEGCPEISPFLDGANGALVRCGPQTEDPTGLSQAAAAQTDAV